MKRKSALAWWSLWFTILLVLAVISFIVWYVNRTVAENDDNKRSVSYRPWTVLDNVYQAPGMSS